MHWWRLCTHVWKLEMPTGPCSAQFPWVALLKMRACIFGHVWQHPYADRLWSAQQILARAAETQWSSWFFAISIYCRCTRRCIWPFYADAGPPPPPASFGKCLNWWAREYLCERPSILLSHSSPAEGNARWSCDRDAFASNHWSKSSAFLWATSWSLPSARDPTAVCTIARPRAHPICFRLLFVSALADAPQRHPTTALSLRPIYSPVRVPVHSSHFVFDSIHGPGSSVRSGIFYSKLRMGPVWIDANVRWLITVQLMSCMYLFWGRHINICYSTVDEWVECFHWKFRCNSATLECDSNAWTVKLNKMKINEWHPRCMKQKKIQGPPPEALHAWPELISTKKKKFNSNRIETANDLTSHSCSQGKRYREWQNEFCFVRCAPIVFAWTWNVALRFVDLKIDKIILENWKLPELKMWPFPPSFTSTNFTNNFARAEIRNGHC